MSIMGYNEITLCVVIQCHPQAGHAKSTASVNVLLNWFHSLGSTFMLCRRRSFPQSHFALLCRSWKSGCTCVAQNLKRVTVKHSYIHLFEALKKVKCVKRRASNSQRYAYPQSWPTPHAINLLPAESYYKQVLSHSKSYLFEKKILWLTSICSTLKPSFFWVAK
jgi:hypothetical protein